MALTRRSLLLGGAAGAVVPAALGLSVAGRAAVDPEQPYLIVLFANGGWDVTFAMDPKAWQHVDGPWVDETGHPDDVEELRVIHGIPVQCNDHKRLSVTRFFETWGPRTAVINGIWTGSIVHQPSRIRLLTGTTSAASPDMATLVGAARGVSVDRPLGTIDFSGLGYTGGLERTTGRVGHRSQLKALLDPTTAFPAPTWADYALPLFTPSTDEEAAITAHLETRARAHRSQFGGATNAHRFADWTESRGRRDQLLAQADTITARLSAGAAPSLDLQADVAVDLLAGGVCHTVTLADPEPIWDTHDANVLQHALYQGFFMSLNRLLANLERLSLLDRTVVVVVSEMTRTPRRNARGGKDHWGHTSQLWIGQGIRGGSVFGATNDTVEALPIDYGTGVATTSGTLLGVGNVAAGLLAHLGVDPEQHLPGVLPFHAASRLSR